jgi:hypothetical protein
MRRNMGDPDVLHFTFPSVVIGPQFENWPIPDRGQCVAWDGVGLKMTERGDRP